MADLEQDIRAYNTARDTYRVLEQDLFARIRDAFESEIPSLNVAVPTSWGVSISRFEVNQPDDDSLVPYVVMYTSDGIPSFRDDGRKADIMEIPVILHTLNEHLQHEYKRIKDRYGFKVHGFMPEPILIG